MPVLPDVRGTSWPRRGRTSGAVWPVRLPPARHPGSAVHHPLLDGASAASGCASDAGRFLDYLSTLFDNQPPQESAGLSDEELAQLGVQTGLSEKFARCVMQGAYLEWAEYVTAKALARGVNGTPSVYVDGMGVPASADAIMSAAMAELR